MDTEKEEQQNEMQTETQNENKALDVETFDKALLALLQEDIPLVSHPYQHLAETFGVTEDFVMRRMADLKERGVLRRLGAILNHQKAGYTVNALTAWNADPKGEETREEALDRVGETLQQYSCVSHCYARVCPPGWDWPVFAMLHAESEEEMDACLLQLMQAMCSTDVRILRTVKEWKKSSMKYF